MNSKNISIKDMLDMSMELWECNKDKWSPMEPQYAKNFVLYMVEEIGEVISIIKKKKDDEIMNNPEVREHFIEEMGDVLMYFSDVLNRYNITPEEFAKEYIKKHNKNLNRDYVKDHKNS